MSEAIKQIVSEFEKPVIDIPSDIMDAIKSSRLDLTQNIPDPQMLVSKGDLPVCTRGNFSFVIGLPGARKSFLCSGIAGAFLSENGCMGLDNPNGTGRLLWIDTEQAPGHVAKIGRRLNRIAGLATNINSENIIIHMLREFQPPMRHKIFDTCMRLYHPDFIVLDGVSDLVADPNSSEQSTSVINDLMAFTKEFDCHVLTVIHANVGSEKARGHLGSEALRKCETAIFAEAKGDITLCKWVKTRDMRPVDFAFMVMEGLPVETEYTLIEAKTDKLRQALSNIMPQHPGTITYSELKQKLMQQLGVKERSAEKNITKAVENGYIIKNQVGCYYLPKVENYNDSLPF
ncbi:AAA family ATPase [Bacteroides ovatus]|uniref:AAA family ATPase n=1 Tax=Bacteroides ovatus TaxID=28116 RepID=UPI00202DBDE1|nr:AAA family ATPase [Bacteroides ovatus]MCM1720789.1 AAA family ATPase [Bacteroides ovatus]MCM1757464.1 AAA family ATPase [Bacteroides ovatus]MCM1865997.1 AAA family ATPase [Bacteroides ovatus]MCM1912593.1 AAA family ATPase [Bacteroides ovatus]